jgi:hypothetical protein
MLRSESELRRLVTRLERDYRQQAGFFSRHALPEYEAVRSLELSPRERALYYTFAVVPFHTHPSGEPKRETGRNGLWQVCATLQRQHGWAFDPDQVLTRGQQRLARLLDRLEVMDEYDARWWHVCAETMAAEFDSDLRGLLAQLDYVAPHVARELRRYRLPGLGDALATPFWLRTLHDQVSELRGTRWLATPVDYRLFRTTARLGEIDLSFGDRDDRRAVGDFWTVYCEKHDRSPMTVAKLLRLLGLYWEPAGRRYVVGALDDLR